MADKDIYRLTKDKKKGGYNIKKDGNKQNTSHHKNKAEGEKALSELGNNSNHAETYVYGKKGIQKANTYPRSKDPKKSKG